VGKKIQLEVRSRPAETLSNIQWAIAGTTADTPNGTAVKDYTMALAATTKSDLSAADLQSQTLDFHWVEGPSRVVSVTAQARGCNLTASVTFTIRRPTLDEFSSRTGPIDIGSPWGGLEMYCGTPASNGLNYKAKVTPPVDGAGHVKFTQILQALLEKDIPSGATVTTQSWSIPAWWLDIDDPYANHGPHAVTASTQITITDNDSPGCPLGPGMVRGEVRHMRFRLYVMYKPSGADSIWVPIGKLTWGWSGKASSTDGGTTWRKDSGAHDATNPSGALTREFAEWVDRKTDSPAHPVWV